ncbi:MAG: polyphosphate kinase 1 [Puniceicoccaceae bacterium]|nr:MAG: polyphosphate kinase 1 [Puniceicoccaceae bacterium]
MSEKSIKKETIRHPYFNRELSWLAFNRRVLEQAQCEDFPLLERMKFLAFVSSNLDEFFEIRVAGLMQQLNSGSDVKGPDGLGPKEQLRRIHNITTHMVQDQYDCWLNQIVPAMQEEQIIFTDYDGLTRNEKSWVSVYFEEQVFPVLTPLAIDPAHPFPFLINKAMNILVAMDDPERKNSEKLMAIVPVPRILPRVVKIGVGRRGAPDVYIFLSDIIQQFAKDLFPGYRVLSAVPFRITRNSDLYIDEEEVENLLKKIEEELHKMEKGAAVRLEIGQGGDSEITESLLRANKLGGEHTFTVSGPVNLMRLMSVYDLIDRPDLKFPNWVAHVPQAWSTPSTFFENLRERDHLLHHPFESFQPFIDFLKEAARDPKVFAIKQTLYRTSGDSPIIEALVEASKQGKQVTVLVEIKARFDEANNIQWARQLEDYGVHVVYGLVGLKTHCKCCMIVRREADGLRRYAHLGTGNYNPKTARLYTDLSFFTANETITAEVAQLFNTLTGFSRTPNFKKLLVAPFNLHSELQKMILREKRNAAAGKPARIIVQTNSLVDQETIDHLYEASQAGVKIDCIVRGICSLVPNIKGQSENIRVRSILGRYLEHSRIFYFENAGGKDPLIYAGSADWMPRNFYRRIEAVFPVEVPELRERIIHILNVYLSDNVSARLLRANGSYFAPPIGKQERVCAQDIFAAEAAARRQALIESKKEPNVPPAAPELAPRPAEIQSDSAISDRADRENAEEML